MKKTLLFFCICFFYNRLYIYRKCQVFSSNSSLLAQRVQNSTLPEKKRDFFINALIFRTPQNLYGKTIKQIIEEEQLIVDQAKRLEKNFTCFER